MSHNAIRSTGNAPHRVSHPNIINKTDDHKTIQYTFNPKTKQKTDDTPIKPVFEKNMFQITI